MKILESISEFMNGYFSTCKRSFRTVKAYNSDLKQFSKSIPRFIDIEEIRPDVLEAWALDLRSQGYASSSIRRKFACLRVFFNYWKRKRVIDESPLEYIHLDLVNEKKLPRVLNEGEIRKLIVRAREELGEFPARLTNSTCYKFRVLRNAAIIELLFATGIRVGELVSLKTSDCMDGMNSLIIKGKGDKQRLAILPDVRSQEVCAAYLRHRHAISSKTDALFINVFYSALSTQGVSNVLAQIAESAGIEQRVTPHMLRHSIATLLLNNGANLRIVQEFLGHASISSTMRYTHVSKSIMAQALSLHHPNNHALAIL